MKNNNLIFAFLTFLASAICSCLLFVGLFSAHWDYIISHTGDTIFVLVVGTLIPITLILGLVLYFRGLVNEEKYAILITICSIPFVLCSVFLGGELFLKTVIKLYEHVLN